MEGPKASRQSLNSSAFALKKQRERAVNRGFFAILTNLSTEAKVADFEDLLIMRARSASLSSSSQCPLSGSPGRSWALYCRFSSACRRSGETGRRAGLKIPWGSPPVRVRFPPPALFLKNVVGLSVCLEATGRRCVRDLTWWRTSGLSRGRQRRRTRSTDTELPDRACVRPSRSNMTKPIPTRRGDVLILETKDTTFRIHAVGPIAKDGEQDFFTGMNVKYVRDRAEAVDTAKAMASSGSRIFLRNLETGEWSEIV
jgi:hypothetical protein